MIPIKSRGNLEKLFLGVCRPFPKMGQEDNINSYYNLLSIQSTLNYTYYVGKQRIKYYILSLKNASQKLEDQSSQNMVPN